jgi:hypothetical protein
MSFARPRLQLADNNTANDVWHCLKAISVAAPPDEGAFLSEVLGSRLLCWVRGVEAIRGNCAIDRDRLRCGTGVGGIIGACDGFARRALQREPPLNLFPKQVPVGPAGANEQGDLPTEIQ